MKLNYSNSLLAQKNIKNYLPRSPLVRNEWLSREYQCNVFLKLDNLLPVGSFKVRGALNKLLNLSEAEKAKGVLAVSAGNHSQGVAFAGSKLGISTKIIMPENAPLIKVMRTSELGAEVVLHGDDFEKAFNYSQQILKEEGRTFVHPYEDLDVIYGQSTMALEIFDDLPLTDFIFTSIGGGGLASGIGLVASYLRPECQMIGAQAINCNYHIQSVKSGKIIKARASEFVSTICDGIKVKSPSEAMVNLVKNFSHEFYSISEDEVSLAIFELLERSRIVSEGAAAINLAAFKQAYAEQPGRFKNKNVVIVICGGNVDVNIIERIIDKGLFHYGRKAKIKIVLSDKPGALSFVTDILGKQQANILNVNHSRGDIDLDVNDSLVEFTLELKNHQHLTDIKKILGEQQFRILK